MVSNFSNIFLSIGDWEGKMLRLREETEGNVCTCKNKREAPTPTHWKTHTQCPRLGAQSSAENCRRLTNINGAKLKCWQGHIRY